MTSSAVMLDLIQKKEKENHPKAYSYSDIWKQFQEIYRSFLQSAIFDRCAAKSAYSIICYYLITCTVEAFYMKQKM